MHVGLGFGGVKTEGDWGANPTGQFRHHPSASMVVLVRKMVGHQLFLNIIPNNFMATTEWKVWCDRVMRGRGMKACSSRPRLEANLYTCHLLRGVGWCSTNLIPKPEVVWLINLESQHLVNTMTYNDTYMYRKGAKCVRDICIYHSVLSCTSWRIGVIQYCYKAQIRRGVVHVGLGFGGVDIEGDREEEAWKPCSSRPRLEANPYICHSPRGVSWRSTDLIPKAGLCDGSI